MTTDPRAGAEDAEERKECANCCRLELIGFDNIRRPLVCKDCPRLKRRMKGKGIDGTDA